MKQLAKDGKLPSLWDSAYWTDTKRKEKSVEKREFFARHPEKHPNRILAGNRTKMTYPERIAYDWLSSSGLVFECQKSIQNYFVDFCVGSIIIEIDGERFHPVGNEKDAFRDSCLADAGYTVYRIRSKERITERLSDIFRTHSLGVGEPG